MAYRQTHIIYRQRHTWYPDKYTHNMTHRQRNTWHTERDTHDIQTETHMPYRQRQIWHSDREMTHRQRHMWHTERDTFEIETKTHMTSRKRQRLAGYREKIGWKCRGIILVWGWVGGGGADSAASDEKGESFMPQSGSHATTTSTNTLSKFKQIFKFTKINCSDADPDPWIQICIIKVGSGSVWRDTNPDTDPGHMW